MTAKVKCLNKISEVGMNLLPDAFQVTEDMAEADAVLVRSAAMHEMELPDGLLAIARAGAGVNNIPLEKCAEQGVIVFNTPGANANGVKEIVIAGMLLAARDLSGGMDWVKANKEDENIGKTMEKAKSQFAGTELKGKTLGVIGLGAIGVLVANAANALGMEVIGCDPFLSVTNALNLSRNVKIVKSNAEIYAACDYITIHVPLLEDTKGMLNKESISAMKDSVIILNFSRDLLINEDDMGEALESGKVAKYVTDFPTKKIASHKNVIAFPHLGASTEESEDNCAAMAVRQLVDFVENGKIANSVNYPAMDVDKCLTDARVCICHKNIPNMLAQFTSVFSAEGINIETMVNKSRGNYAYSVLDVCAKVSDESIQKLDAINGVCKVRVIQ